MELAKKMGKTPVRLRVEVPGFVSNRIFLRLLQEACREVESGEATIEEVDSSARNKLKLPMGIFELADYVGLDVVVDLWKVIVERGPQTLSAQVIRRRWTGRSLGSRRERDSTLTQHRVNTVRYRYLLKVRFPGEDHLSR